MISRTLRSQLVRIAADAVVEHLKREGYTALIRGGHPYSIEVFLIDRGTGYDESICVKIQGRQ